MRNTKIKCPRCDGTGVVIFENGTRASCPKCFGSGKTKRNKLPTNEEWFYSLPTKEKAKTIICLAVNAMYKYKQGLIDDTDVDEIMRWLKEKHHER